VVDVALRQTRGFHYDRKIGLSHEQLHNDREISLHRRKKEKIVANETRRGFKQANSMSVWILSHRRAVHDRGT